MLKSFKRAVASVFIACLITVLVPAIAVADEGPLLQPSELETQPSVYESGSNGTCTWTLYDDGHLVISPTDGEEGTVGANSLLSAYKPYVVTASFEGTVHASAQFKMLAGCASLKSIDFTNFDTSGMTTMSEMLADCTSLESVDLSSFETAGITSMEGLFSNCSSLTSVNLSGLDYSKVTNMGELFSNCSQLTSVVATGWDTPALTYTAKMFRGCSSLKSLNLAGINTSQVTHMNRMFAGCSSLETLDLSGFNTSHVSSMVSMFEGCSALESLDLSSFNTLGVRSMNRMFADCSSLESVNLSSFDTRLVTDLESMFAGCSVLESIDLSSFNTSSVTSMKSMFEGCVSVEQVKLGASVSKLASFPEGSTGYWTSAKENAIVSVDEILAHRLGTADTYTEVPSSASLANAEITITPDVVTYTGQELRPSVTVRLSGETLQEDVDYTLTYKSNVEIGTATVVARGIGAHIGKKEATFGIVAAEPEGEDSPDGPENPDGPGSGSGSGGNEGGGEPGGNAGGDADNQGGNGEGGQPDNPTGGEPSDSGSGKDPKPSTPDTPNQDSSDPVGDKDDNKGSSSQVPDGNGGSSAQNPDSKGTLPSDGNAGKPIDDNNRAAKKLDPLAYTGSAKKAGFTDLDNKSWYMKVPDGAFVGTDVLYMDYAVGSGLMSGYSGTTLFGPDDTVSRATVATVIYRLATGATADTAANNVTTRFSDVPAGQWYTAAIAWCDEKGVITGYTGTNIFDPDKDVTREELALMICRYCVNVAGMEFAGTNVSTFPDGNLVSDWAVKGVAFCSAHGIVSGYSDSGRFDPAGNATRCQMAKIIALTAQLLG